MAERNATLRALMEGIVYDLLPKTNVYNVYVDSATTLAAKLAEVITSLNGKVTQQQLAEALREALAQAKESGEFNGSDGTGIVSVTIKEV